ncbi:hypothetical protein Tco_1222135 [Tanacetum coccineum]
MEDEEVPMVDGVIEGAFGALGDETWFGNGSSSGCHGGSLSLEEKVIILLRRSGNVLSLVIEWIKGVKIGGRRWGTSMRSTIILIIISLNLIRIESDILAFDGAV